MDEHPQEFSENELKLHTPVRLFCSGPSGSGKTTFLTELLNNLDDIFDKPVKNIVICYGAHQPLYDHLKRNYPKEIKFVKGFPNFIENYLSNSQQHDLLIIDDLSEEVSNSKFFLQMYMKLGHHWNFSIITVLHNLFFQSKYLRTCSLQATGFILFKTLRGRDQIQVLGRQIFPKNPLFILDSYNEATTENFNYLYIDLSPYCPDDLRVRGNIFPHKELMVYLPNNE